MAKRFIQYRCEICDHGPYLIDPTPEEEAAALVRVEACEARGRAPLPPEGALHAEGLFYKGIVFMAVPAKMEQEGHEHRASLWAWRGNHHGDSVFEATCGGNSYSPRPLDSAAPTWPSFARMLAYCEAKGIEPMALVKCKWAPLATWAEYHEVELPEPDPMSLRNYTAILADKKDGE